MNSGKLKFSLPSATPDDLPIVMASHGVGFTQLNCFTIFTPECQCAIKSYKSIARLVSICTRKSHEVNKGKKHLIFTNVTLDSDAFKYVGNYSVY